MRDSRQDNGPSAGAKLSVEWGYEVHSLTIGARDWARIKAGEELSLQGEEYAYDGEMFKCGWHFNGDGPGSLIVNYCPVGGNAWNTGDGYVGTWKSALR